MEIPNKEIPRDITGTQPLPVRWDPSANGGQGDWVLLLDPSVTLSSVIKNGSMKTAPTGRNDELLAAETLAWDGVVTSRNTADINVPTGAAVSVRVDNRDQAQALTVTFSHKVGSDYVPYFGADGVQLSFAVPGNTDRIFGPIQGWPRFAAGRVTVTAASAPTDTNTTLVTVQEV